MKEKFVLFFSIKNFVHDQNHDNKNLMPFYLCEVFLQEAEEGFDFTQNGLTCLHVLI